MTDVLTSTRNPRVQAARRLLRRTHRTKENAFLLEGRTAVADALAAGAEIAEVFIVPGPDTDEVSAAANEAGLRPLEVAPAVLAAITETVTPQGVVALASSPAVGLGDLPEAPELVLVLAGVSDPGNAGALLRTAAAAKADAVIFTEGSVDPLNPKVVRSSSAALFLTKVVRDAPLETTAGDLKDRGCTLFGASAHGKNVFTEVDMTSPLALFVGNESSGIPGSVLNDLDGLVSIPMPGLTESLNVGIAGSILLFEAVRQRRYGA